MTWISKSIFGITDKRKEQLHKEKKIDEILQKCESKCPQVLIKYLFWCREQNRIQCENVLEKNIFSQFELIGDNLSQNDIHLDNVINNEDNICYFLEALLSKESKEST